MLVKVEVELASSLFQNMSSETCKTWGLFPMPLRPTAPVVVPALLLVAARSLLLPRSILIINASRLSSLAAIREEKPQRGNVIDATPKR